MADKKTVRAAIKAHEKLLLSNPDVVGVGVAEESGNAQMVVYVSDIKGKATIPETLEVNVGGKRDKLDVRVVEVGKIAPR